MDVKKEPDTVSFEEYLSHLNIKHERILKLENYLSRGNSISKEKERAYSEELDNILKLLSFNPYQEKLSMIENTDKEVIDPVEAQDKYRYLCVSDGFTICCLDLKQSTVDCTDGSSGLQKIPSKISTLKLLQEHLLFSLGLFSFSSHAYMVGGHEFLGIEDSDLLDLMNHSSDFDLYSFLLKKCIDKSGALCCEPHLLTLDQGSLCLSECSIIRSTSIPTFWPLVEQFDDHLHVIESLPSLCCDEIMHPNNYDHIPSHEVFVLSKLREGGSLIEGSGCRIDGGGSWIDLSPPLLYGIGSCMYIHKYLVVGHRIYAIERYIGRRFLVFDYETNKWESHVHPYES